MIEQVYPDTSKIWEPAHNTRRQNNDMKQVPHRWPTILGAVVQKLVARTIWPSGFVHAFVRDSKVKVKFTLGRATMAQRLSIGIALLFL